MDKKSHPLTNEVLAKKFKNNFELVNYAIKLAEIMIKTGRDARVKSDSQNRALLVLAEISEGKDLFDVIPEHAEKKIDFVPSNYREERRGRHDDRSDRYERRSESTDNGAPENKSERRKAKFALSDE